MDHTYTATITWTGNRGEGTRSYRGYGREHDIACPGKPVLRGSADPAYRGDADRHNPEDLLVAALSACHMLWYLHLSASAGVVVTAYEDRAEGTMRTQADGAGEFTGVTLRPRVTITG
ncbi:MAG: OsmC family protein, partial [Rhodospirillaceae bacterium]|nr:OsmC family protein [Rhodospirillaceae bacterium]